MTTFGISVIICVYNGAKRITPTLKALLGQKIPVGLQCELLIIDNASTDSTSSIAEEFWEENGSPFPLTILPEPKPGKANALVTGYNAAQFELMLLCDDDNWLQPEYLKTVSEIYAEHPEIGMLGGYGKAYFDPGEKPQWFDSWDRCYVCRKIHLHNGFLKKMDRNIWGAGSVIRKTIWNFLTNRGFAFYNSTNGGKAMTEDTELAMAISFTGQRLYFDDRLWFAHDLRGGRVTWDNLMADRTLNGKNHAIIYMYYLAFKHAPEHCPSIIWYLNKKIIGLVYALCKSMLKRNNFPAMTYLYHTIVELYTNYHNYKTRSFELFSWVGKVKDSFPLMSENCFTGTQDNDKDFPNSK